MAQSQERRVKMKKISQIPSSRGGVVALFLLFTRFTDHGTACPGLGMEAFGASWRFSPWLWWSSGCSQLLQKGGHRPSYLRQRQHRVARLPRSIATHHLWTSQDQQIVRTGHHLGPAFGALRGTQPWDIDIRNSCLSKR